MMIAVAVGQEARVRRAVELVEDYMLITDPKNPSVGYFAWSISTDGTPRSTGAAPDGEEYYTMALYFAAHRWGNGKGIYNYQAEADKILRGMRHHPGVDGNGAVPDSPGGCAVYHARSSLAEPQQPRTGSANERRLRQPARASRHRLRSDSDAGRAPRRSGRWWTRKISS